MNPLLPGLFLVANVVTVLLVLLLLEHADGLARRLVRLAVRCLPRAHRRRYYRKWTAALRVLSHKPASMLVEALKMLASAPRTGWALRARPPITEGDLGLGLAVLGIWLSIVGLTDVRPGRKLALLVPGILLSVLLVALYRWWGARQPPKKKVAAT
jgi:hypothetical protein